MIKIFLGIALLLLASSPAYAYIDPGTGSFILQGLIASFLSLFFAIKTYWQRLKNFITAKLSPAHRNPSHMVEPDKSHENN